MDGMVPHRSAPVSLPPPDATHGGNHAAGPLALILTQRAGCREPARPSFLDRSRPAAASPDGEVPDAHVAAVPHPDEDPRLLGRGVLPRDVGEVHLHPR